MKGFGEIWQPLPRWAVLPGDPAPLRSWLRAQTTKDTEPDAQERDRDQHGDEGRAA